ncbi:hypothetical protein LEP1GSC188_2864 [Leptospira weilii serovar Topaz str. LT2116]|uniref:Uncharacterized protein n=1 Tax=Leptospira weilii serovar Topaz str. LT2116 TaxID=1088540 RepID=M3H1U6_9LEPT|nr:hypothetical protein LEP1GSC188_2864 [Leptospira weilii serovar Topaz str. LT2116]
MSYRNSKLVDNFVNENYPEVKEELYYRVVWNWLPKEI